MYKPSSLWLHFINSIIDLKNFSLGGGGVGRIFQSSPLLNALYNTCTSNH